MRAQTPGFCEEQVRGAMGYLKKVTMRAQTPGFCEGPSAPRSVDAITGDNAGADAWFLREPCSSAISDW